MTIVAASFVLGLASSVHCVVMCGPLMAMLHRRGGRTPGRDVVMYHAGRVGTYALLGALAGWFGQTITGAGFGRGLSILTGSALLVAALGGAGLWPRRWASAWNVGAGRLWARVRSRGARWGVAGPAVAGMGNALLPCGMLYMALAGVTTLADVGLSAVSALAFGVGTTPALAATWWSLATLRGRWPVKGHSWAWATPAVLALTGLLLIGRGVATPHLGAAPPSIPTSATGHVHGLAH